MIRVNIMNIKLCMLLGLFGVTVVVSAAPTVSNVHASQRDGSCLVDLYYDLSGVLEGATVSVELSSDAGENYSTLIGNLVGDVGDGLGNGIRRHIVWDSGVELVEIFSSVMRFRVTADEYIQPTVSTFFLTVLPIPDVPEGEPEVHIIPFGLVVEGDVYSETYRWFHNGRTVIGANGFYLTLRNVTRSDAGTYVFEVTVNGVTYSDSVELNVLYEEDPVEAGGEEPSKP